MGLYTLTEEDFKVFKKAIQKQFPKKPKLVKHALAPFDDSDMYQCCTCNHFIANASYEYPKIKYCPNCGQAIDWEE